MSYLYKQFPVFPKQWHCSLQSLYLSILAVRSINHCKRDEKTGAYKI